MHLLSCCNQVSSDIVISHSSNTSWQSPSKSPHGNQHQEWSLLSHVSNGQHGKTSQVLASHGRLRMYGAEAAWPSGHGQSVATEEFGWFTAARVRNATQRMVSCCEGKHGVGAFAEGPRTSQREHPCPACPQHGCTRSSMGEKVTSTLPSSSPAQVREKLGRSSHCRSRNLSESRTCDEITFSVKFSLLRSRSRPEESVHVGKVPWLKRQHWCHLPVTVARSQRLVMRSCRA